MSELQGRSRLRVGAADGLGSLQADAKRLRPPDSAGTRGVEFLEDAASTLRLSDIIILLSVSLLERGWYLGCAAAWAAVIYELVKTPHFPVLLVLA